MKKLLFFSCEPGGAEVLTPVIRLTQKSGYDVHVLAYGYASERFRSNGITYTEIPPISSTECPFLTELAPDFVLTSATSIPAQDMSEKYLWLHARNRGIRSLGFIDQWQNYALRFSGPGTNEHLSYLPDFINCIDTIGKREMLAEGFPKERLLSFGHPHLGTITERYAKVDRESILAKTGINPHEFNADEALMFISEPLREHYGASRGYDQYSVLAEFLNCTQRSRKRAQLLIRLHPKDNHDNFQDCMAGYSDLNVHFIGRELNSLECLSLSNRIFGMTSIMLIEAFLLGKSTVSLQPGLILTDPLILTRCNLIPRITELGNFDPYTCYVSQHSTINVRFNESEFLLFLEEQTENTL